MNLHDFIFSPTPRYRLARHLTFWLCWFLYASAVQLTGMNSAIMSRLTGNDIIGYQITRSVNRLVPAILFCYLVVYFLVPRFIHKKKYLSFFLLLLLSFLLLMFVTYFVLNIPGGLARFIFVQWALDPFISKFFSFYSNINFTGALPACCVMLTIKYYKDWYQKERVSQVLRRENNVAELQLLKAQIHPHFLFNTLNNIYSFTLTGSPQAAGLVDKLSGMIDYMTSEGEKALVPVEKELQLIRDYIGLEKVRYGDRLDLQVEISGAYGDKMMAPLLMIPFVENCFKHGASVMRGKQWISLNIHVSDNLLDFKLGNSKPPESAEKNSKKGIGLTNVQKRLQLLYPGKHFLKIEVTKDTYLVHLQVGLQASPVLDHYFKLAPNLQAV